MAIFKFYHPTQGYQTLSYRQLISLERAKVQVSELTQNSAHTISLKVGNVTVFTRTFYPLNSVIELDIHDDIAEYLSITNMNADFGRQTLSFATCTLSCSLGATTSTQMFTAYLAENAWSDGDPRLTDIDILNVSRDTTLRLSIPNLDGHYQGDTTLDLDLFVKTHRGVKFVKTISFLQLADSDGLLYGEISAGELSSRFDEPFQILFGKTQGGFQPAPSPIYRLVPAKAEQYAFLNRFGAVDVVPMFGELSLATDFTFRSGSSESARFRIDARSDKAYTQNSGNLTRTTLDAMASLLTSRQAWHRIDGVWHEIIIEEADTMLSTAGTLHSCTFKFRYADKSISNHKI